MTSEKYACVVYVAAAKAALISVREKLEKKGYTVCESVADLGDAIAAQAGSTDLPPPLLECISQSDLCVFILPNDEAQDGILGTAAGVANQLGKPIVGVVAGERATYPENFDDHAQSMVRQDSDGFDDAIQGTEIWELPDRTRAVDRPIKHIRCQ